MKILLDIAIFDKNHKVYEKFTDKFITLFELEKLYS